MNKYSFEIELSKKSKWTPTADLIRLLILDDSMSTTPDMITVTDVSEGFDLKKTDARTHCDDFIPDHRQPRCLRAWLLMKRLPAYETMLLAKYLPPLYATKKGTRIRVRLVAASRMGDVGITTQLTHEHGYEERLMLGHLVDFSNNPDPEGT
jgi:hypothetical protein